MVAVITGNGLGLGNTSLTQLGRSQGGSPSLGQAGNRSYVNSATGNLVLQSGDEGMLFDGLPLNVLRTYNSLGQLSSNGWSYGFSRTVNGLTGTLNAAGSTITRTDDDGSSVVYTYDATLGVYQSTHQSGAVDTLSWNATSSTWTWTGAAHTQETYNATGQLTALTDTSSGASYSFSYSNGQLSQITAGDGDTLLFGYNTNNQLISLSIQAIPPGQSTAVTRQAVGYGYDSQGRLTSVTTTLASDTNSGATTSYTTTYAYQGTTDLISSVTQSDGTVVSYTYTQDTQGAYQVTGITTGSDSAAQTLTLSYGTNTTTITDGLGNATQYTYNAQGQLTQVIAPAVNGVSPTTAYTYDANGNVLTRTDPNGAVTNYTYDPSGNGNLWSVEDGAGNTVSYTYNAADQVTSQTTYTVAAQGQPGQSGYVAPSGAQTTYYVYTATNQLAYTIDPLGHVTEHDYTTVNGLSELTTTRQYLGATYSLSNATPRNPPTLANLQAWVQSSAVQSTLSQSTRTDITYDVRGQLATQTQYDTVDSNGNGVLTHGTVITIATYDAQGRLLHTSTETGTNRNTLQTTTYAYDGLGRVLSTTDPLGNVTSYVYTDSANTMAITQANGLTTTQVRNSAGQLLSSTQSASGQSSRTTRYLYNADGQAIAAIDPAGNVTYTFYNADGEVTGTVDGDGNVTAYTVDADGHVIQATQYAAQVNPASWISGGALTGSYPTSLPVPLSTANDRTTTTLYNAAGQVVATIDPANNVVTTLYDGAGHVLATTRYATPLTPTQRTALGSHPTLAALQADLTSNANNRTTLTIDDADGRAAATIDAQGYVTLTTYNAAGEAVLQTAYATALSSSQLSSLGDTPTLAAVQADLTTSANDQTTRTYYDGEGRAVATVDADGYLTTTTYDETTHVTTTTRYVTALTSSQLGALTGTENVATLVGLLGSNPGNEQSTATTDADGHVTSRVSVEGVATPYTYYAYNSVGQVVGTATMPSGEQGAVHTTSTTYDAFGDTVSTTDAANATTTYVYNTLGQPIEATDALGNSTWSYYDADGKLLYTIEGQPSGSTPNALGNVTAYQYNAFGEVTRTTTYAGQLTLTTTGSSSGTTLNVATATTAQITAALATPLAAPSGDADATTLTAYTLDGQVATVTDGNGYVTATTYDAFGDATQVLQQLSQPGSALSASNSTTTTYAYDTRGERVSEIDGVGTSIAATTTETYDAFGRVTSRTTGNGSTITYTYDALGRQVSSSQTVQGATRTTQTTYDAFGQVLTETDALGNVTTFGYNISTHTLTTTTPLGVTMSQVKDAFGDTVSVTDGGGHTTTYTYDADGRLLTTTDALGNVSRDQYDADGHLIQTTDATGHVLAYTYDANGRVLTQTVDPSGLRLVTTYSYDGQGRQLSVTDPTGSITTYRYDAGGHVLTKVVDATGLALTTTYTYDGAGKTLTVTTGAGTSAATTTQYVYDNLERLSQTIVAPGSLNLTTRYSYDANNNLTSTTDPNGNVTRVVYDEANEKVYTIDPTGAVTQTWYDADGRLTATRTYTTRLTASQLSALGSTPTIAAVTADLTTTTSDSYKQNVYNADGQVIYHLDGIGLNPTQYTYNAAGQVTQIRQYATALSTSSLSPTATPATVAGYLTASPNDVITTTAYNADGQAVYVIDGAGDVTQTLYDAAGRVTKTIAYATPLTATQLAGLGSAPTTAQIAALITTSANDRSTVTSYDTAGRVVYTVDAAGAVTQTWYDADGRVTATRAYATALAATQLATLGSTPTPQQIGTAVPSTSSDQVTYKVYDGAGELRYTIDPIGYVTETRYDTAGRVSETLAYGNPVNWATVTSQNLWGPLANGTALPSMAGLISGSGNTDANAEATLYLYDTAGRRAFTVQQNGTAGQVTGYAYDANGNVTSQTVYGSTLTLNTSQSLSAQLTTASVTNAVASFPAHTTATVYDADNRALYTIDALNHVTQLSYDGVGRVIETQQYATPITLPGTLTASTLAAAVAAAGTTGVRISTTSYTSRGQVISTADSLGTNASYGYNALGQKTSYTNRDGATWHYVYDTAGRLIQTQSPSVTVGSYNSSGQFQSTASQYLYTTNSYDAFGDVLSTAQGYGASASAITTVSTTSYAYDALGRRIQTTDALGHLTTTTYNALGQAVVAKDGNGSFTYSVYDADGRVLDRIDGNGSITAYTYDAYGNVLTTTQYATALNPSAITGWSAGQPLTAAQVQQGLVTSSSDRTTTTTYNQLNQKTQVVQPSIAYDLSMGALSGNVATGSPTTAYTYDAYGNVTSVAQLVQGALTVGSTTTPAIWATTYTYYDALNRAVMTVTPTGSYTSPQGYVTTTAYNAFGQVTSSTQYAQAISTGSITTTTQPGLPPAPTVVTGGDRVTSTTYDAIGRVTSKTQTGNYTYTGGTLGAIGGGSVGYASASSVTSYGYDGESRVISQTVNGATTTTTYDALGRVMTVTAPARQALVSNWQSLLTSTPADDLTTAALYTSVSPVTAYVYGALGHAVSTTVAAGGLTQQSTASYNALGQLIQSVDANGTAHTFTYDANGNLLTQSYALGGSIVTTTHTYDAANQRLSTAVQRSGVSTYDSYTQQKYDAFGEVIAKGDNTGYEAAYTYNAAGQQSSAPDSRGALHTYGYDLVGNLVVDRSTVTGGASAVWTHNTYNLSNQVISQITPATNAATGENSASVTMGYDRWGNVTSKTDANGNVTTYHYDSQNHLTQQLEANVLVVSAAGVYTWTSPTKEWYYNVDGELMATTDENGNSSWYGYDAVGNQTVAQDNIGNRTYTAYDALGRAVATQTPPVQTATGTLANITFTTYDNLNQVIAQGYFLLNSAGTARTLVTQNTYTLDAGGNRIQTTDALGHSIRYTYDSQHRVLASTTPLNETTTYVYDVNGNLVHQTDADGYTQSWTYSYFKQVQTHTDESGATYTYTYDANSGLLTTETSNWTATGPSSSTTSTLSFGYEADGALASLTEAVVSGSSTVTSTYGFSYDANGNETLETISTQDGGGNAVGSQIVIAYDSHNRLQEVTDENGAGTSATMRSVYVYDADGNRRAVFTRSAYDAQGTSSTPIAATPIPLTAGNPTLGTALTAQTAPPGVAQSYNVSGNFTDPLGMGLTYTVTGLPSWLSMNGTTGVISGTPPVPTAPASYTVTVTAMDALGRSVSGSFTVTVPTVNPVFTSAPSNQTAQPGQAWSYQAPAATDANGFSVTYSYSGNLPPGISFNAATRTFSGTPSTGGAYAVTYMAKSSANTTVSNSFTITVPNVAPAFTGSVSNQTLLPGTSLNYQAPAATDANGYGVTYSAQGVPLGITFNASTRTFSGSLTTAGTYTITYTATSAANTTASQTFTITVPSVTVTFTSSPTNQTVYVGKSFSFTEPGATDSQSVPIGYSASYYNGSNYVSLPSWISFNPTTLTFSGTAPTTGGTYGFQVWASAGGQVSSLTAEGFTFTVSNPSAPTYSGPTSVALTDVSTTAGATQTYANVFSGTGMSYQVSIPASLNGFTASVDANGSMYLHAPVVTWPPKAGTVTIVGTDVLGRQVTARIAVEVYPSSGAGGPAVVTKAASTSTTAMTMTAAASPAPSPTPNIVANWYTYDADSRVLVANGSLQNGQIVLTTATNSGQNAYDAAGDLAMYTTVNATGQSTSQKYIYNPLGQKTLIQTQTSAGSAFANYQTNAYDADGHLTSTVTYQLPGSTEAGTYNGTTISFSDAGWIKSDVFYTYNADGELVDQSEYDEDSAQDLVNQYQTTAAIQNSTYATQDQSAPSSLPSIGAATDGALYLSTENNYQAISSGYGYDADGNLLGYRVITGGHATVANTSPTAGTTNYQNSYVLQNAALMSQTVQTGSAGNLTNTNTYNNLGELIKTSGTVNGTSQTNTMAYTADGQVLQKINSPSGGTVNTAIFLYAGQQGLGSVNTNGTINVLATTGGYTNGSLGTQNYTTQSGDTLAAIAWKVYGDSHYAYILAEANGLQVDSPLSMGMVLHIPQVTTTANASDTFQPYAQNGIVNGGATACETTAQIVTASIQSVLNQQSAFAQTVAQIEQQQQALATAKQQAEALQKQLLEDAQALADAKDKADVAKGQADQAKTTAQAAQAALNSGEQAAQSKAAKAAAAALAVKWNQYMAFGVLQGAAQGAFGGSVDDTWGSMDGVAWVAGDGGAQQNDSSWYQAITSAGGIFNYMSSGGSGGSGEQDWITSQTDLGNLFAGWGLGDPSTVPPGYSLATAGPGVGDSNGSGSGNWWNGDNLGGLLGSNDLSSWLDASTQQQLSNLSSAYQADNAQYTSLEALYTTDQSRVGDLSTQYTTDQGQYQSASGQAKLLQGAVSALQTQLSAQQSNTSSSDSASLSYGSGMPLNGHGPLVDYWNAPDNTLLGTTGNDTMLAGGNNTTYLGTTSFTGAQQSLIDSYVAPAGTDGQAWSVYTDANGDVNVIGQQSTDANGNPEVRQGMDVANQLGPSITPSADDVNQANSFLANAGTGVGNVDEFGQSADQPNTFNLGNAYSNIWDSDQSFGTKLSQTWDLMKYEVPNADKLAATQVAKWQQTENPYPEVAGLESMNSASAGLYGILALSGVSDQHAYAVAQGTSAAAPLLGSGLLVAGRLSSQGNGEVPSNVDLPPQQVGSPYFIRIDPTTGSGPMAIDSSTFTSGTLTLNGGIRNARQFWSQWSDAYPETLSDTNVARIQMGQSPVVDDAWISEFPEHTDYSGETLIHHHLDYGPNAVPLPGSVHSQQPGWGIWHPNHSGQ